MKNTRKIKTILLTVGVMLLISGFFDISALGVVPPVPDDKTTYALVVAGTDTTSDGTPSNSWAKSAKRVYDTLLRPDLNLVENAGDIYYLVDQDDYGDMGTYDDGKDGHASFYYLDIYLQIIGSKIKPTDDLIVFITCHGRSNIWGDYLTIDDGWKSVNRLDDWLDDIVCDQMTVIIEACDSYFFVNNLEGNNRYVCCGNKETSYTSQMSLPFYSALSDGDANGKPRCDELFGNSDGRVTFTELDTYMEWYRDTYYGKVTNSDIGRYLDGDYDFFE